MFSIVYVCTGNTCRSPMAEGLLTKMLEDAGIEDVDVSSAGTGTLDGYPVTLYAAEAMRRKGIDISDHHSQRVTRKMVKESGLIFALAENHHRFLQEQGVPEGKLFMVKSFPEPGNADAEHSINDPIGGTFEEYQRVADEIEKEIRRSLPEIISRIKAKDA